MMLSANDVLSTGFPSGAQLANAALSWKMICCFKKEQPRDGDRAV